MTTTGIIKCNRCKGTHENREQVRACYNAPLPKRTAPPKQGPRMATDGQKDYINDLLRRLGTKPEKPVDEITFDEASPTIDGLKAALDVKRSLETTIGGQNPTKGMQPNIIGKQVPDGTFTVVFDEEADERITVRFHTPRMGKWNGIQLIEYLVGPSNELDYERCANRVGDGYRIWNRFKGDGSVWKGISFILDADNEARAAAGEAYALASSRCARCGRKLTVPASIHRGLGPECASMGWLS